jgi:hypothetical protein
MFGNGRAVAPMCAYVLVRIASMVDISARNAKAMIPITILLRFHSARTRKPRTSSTAAMPVKPVYPSNLNQKRQMRSVTNGLRKTDDRHHISHCGEEWNEDIPMA